MKRWIAALLCLLLLCPCALAENAPLALNWEETEPLLEQRAWKGEFVRLEEYGIQLWVPEGYEAVMEEKADLLDALPEGMDDEAVDKMGELLDLYSEAANVSKITAFRRQDESTTGLLTVRLVGPGIPADTVPQGATAITVNGMQAALWKKQVANLMALFDKSQPASDFYMFGFVYTGEEQGVMLDMTYFEPEENEELSQMFIGILSSLQPLE